MSKTTFTAERRAEIAWGWASSGMPQAAYAREHGISDRTLREWIAQFVLPFPSPDAVRNAIRQTIAELERVLAAYDAAACQPAESGQPAQPAEELKAQRTEEERPASPAAPATATSDVAPQEQQTVTVPNTDDARLDGATRSTEMSQAPVRLITWL